jgi:hypothetical protein
MNAEMTQEACATLCDNYAKLTDCEVGHDYAELIRKTPLKELEFLMSYSGQ